MDSAQWTQEFGVARSMGEGGPIANACSKTSMERKVRPQKEQAVNCPRCHSTNTKFCYYNNYSLTQPRYFCKTCRRYWTEGGTLRNVPVGGGSRKNKRSHDHKHLPDLNPPSISPFSSQNPKIHDQGQDLNLGFPHPQFLDFPKIETTRDHISSTAAAATATPLSPLNFFTNGGIGIGIGIAARGFFPMPTAALHDQTNATNIFASGFPFQECKPPPPPLSFPPAESRYEATTNGAPAHQDTLNNGTLMFTLGASRPNSTDQDQDKGQENSNGFWNGMLGGGSW